MHGHFFKIHEQLCTDFPCFDPNHFKPDVTLQKNSLIDGSDKISNYRPGIMYEYFLKRFLEFFLVSLYI